MSDFFARQAGADRNDLKRSLGALVGIAQGLICDGELNDQEMRFLDHWLDENRAIASVWPGDVIHARVHEALSHGTVTHEERVHLIEMLSELIGAPPASLPSRQHVTELGFDHPDEVVFKDRQFCLTGDFIYGPRETCEAVIARRGGLISSVTKKLSYLVVGSRGSREWKHGSFGTKFEKAMQYKLAGCSLLIVTENQWTASL